MSVKHVGAPNAPGMQAANPRRSVNTAAARPAQKSAVVPGESKPFTDSEFAAAPAPQGNAKPVTPAAATDNRTANALPGVPPGAEVHHAPEQAAPEAAETTAATPLTGISAAVDYYAIISKTVA